MQYDERRSESRHVHTEPSSSRPSGSMTFGLVMLILLGALFVVGPWFIPETMHIGSASKLILLAVGCGISLLGGIVLIITRLYRKTSADEAFVKTGSGGSRVVIDGGAIVIPVIHNVTPVSLQSLKLEVKRIEADALITQDCLRADVEAVFYVRVRKEAKDILTAATSLGTRSGNAKAVLDLIGDKLIAALRDVASTKTLSDLNTNRKEFGEAVKQAVEADLQANGLTLESVNISKLDQAPLTAMRPDTNVFDSQGMRTITETVQGNRVKTNELQLDADRKVKERTVETVKFIAAQEVAEAIAKANADAEKAKAKAVADAEAAKAAAQQQQTAGMARVTAEQAVKVAMVRQQEAIAVAEQGREQAQQTAEVAKEKAIELAQREKQIAVAQAEKQAAEAKAQQLAAENSREAAAQAVKTTEITAAANREKAAAVIAKQAAVEQVRIERQMAADVAAYTQVKEAEGAQEAAEKQAAARIQLAGAEKQAAVLKAEGEKAVQMVPVQVAGEQVAVQQKETAVKIQYLEGQARFETIARDLQVKLAEIQAGKEARIEAAKAVAHAFSQANIKIFSDPSQMQRMLMAVMQGQAIGNFAESLSDAVPADLKNLASAGAGAVGLGLAALLKKVTGLDLDPAALDSLVRSNGPAPAAPAATPAPAGASGDGAQNAIVG